MDDDDGQDSGSGGYGGGFVNNPYAFAPICTPSNPTGLPSANDLAFYDGAGNMLTASMSANIGTTNSPTPNAGIGYFGISGSAVSPVGGAEFDAGFYSDRYGMVGSYIGAGPSAGIPAASLSVVYGHIQALSGESVSISAGGSYGLIGVSRTWSIDASTGEVTGQQTNVGLSFGSPISGSASYTNTSTSEFTSLYLVYIQFLNWISYPNYN